MRFLNFFFLTIFAACHHSPGNVQKILSISESNQVELQKVIDHYKKIDDPNKLQAAYFLISNMRDKYSLDGEAVTNFDVFFTILDSFYHKQGHIANNSPFVQQTWDSLVQIYGRPSIDEADQLEDYRFLKADYLIDQIDLAFKIKDEIPWGKSLLQNQFFEYVLPYRIGNERIENWRRCLYNKYKLFRDTTKTKTRFQYASAINAALKSLISSNHTLWSYPFSMPASIMEKGHLGACIHLVSYAAMVMRANGLPVGIDQVRLWGNHGGNHQWNVLAMEDGSFYPFGAATDSLEGKEMFTYKFSKAFRTSFENQNADSPKYPDEIPPHLINDHLIDVTSEYTKAYAGNKGIFVMKPANIQLFGATGHATLYDGSGCVGGVEHCYFEAEGGVAKIILFKLN